jgi:hypothetical protein
MLFLRFGIGLSAEPLARLAARFSFIVFPCFLTFPDQGTLFGISTRSKEEGSSTT